MTLTETAPRLTFSTTSSATVEADTLVVPVFGSEDDLRDVVGLDDATGGAITRARASGAIDGQRFHMFSTAIVDERWATRYVLVVGAGERDSANEDVARHVASAATLSARRAHAERVAIVNRFDGNLPRLAQAIAEGVVIAGFEVGAYKTGDGELSRILAAVILDDRGGDGLDEAVARGAVLGDCTNIAKTLANEPGNVLPPRLLAERAAEIVRPAGVGVEILDEEAIARLDMGLLLGVAKGSAEPPRLIVLRHDPPNAPEGEVLGLVGKGITFDTGGISIKPADKLDQMKDDMTGGAAVIGAMRAIGLLGAPVRVIGIVPSAENMPGSKAIRPGDVLTAASGTTVEVMNTDAEGRLVLGDGLWYARQLGATRLVDVATLTGACVVALGKTTSGLFGTPDAWVETVGRAASLAGDRMWPMPVFDDYRDLLRSEIADIANSGSRAAGAITAALFLKEFVGALPWTHIDIAGTAWCEDATPYQAKGPTGVAVRTLAELAFTSAEW